jgi:hypothetical protein
MPEIAPKYCDAQSVSSSLEWRDRENMNSNPWLGRALFPLLALSKFDFAEI